MHVHCTSSDQTQACVVCVQQCAIAGHAPFQTCTDLAALLDLPYICHRRALHSQRQSRACGMACMD